MLITINTTTETTADARKKLAAIETLGLRIDKVQLYGNWIAKNGGDPIFDIDLVNVPDNALYAAAAGRIWKVWLALDGCAEEVVVPDRDYNDATISLWCDIDALSRDDDGV